MNLENQVCSLELAKKLRELGIKQKSLWSWTLSCDMGSTAQDIQEGIMRICLHNAASKSNNIENYSAFTVAELGEMLSKYGKRAFATWKTSEDWYCFDINERDFKQYADTEANARAKMLIHLIENKLVEFNEIVNIKTLYQ